MIVAMIAASIWYFLYPSPTLMSKEIETFPFFLHKFLRIILRVFLHLINFPIVFAQNFAAIFASQFFPEKLAQKFVVTFAEILAIAKIIENIYGFFWKMQNFSQKKYEKKYGQNLNLLYDGLL